VASTGDLEVNSEKFVNTFVSTAAATAIFAALAGAGPALADESTERADTPSVVVKYHSSEVTTSGGAERLYGRIHTAAWHVCSDMFPANNGSGALENLQCIHTLTDDAVKQVNSPRLTEVFEQREGYAPPG
jgi:UrcA family protein